MNWIERFMDLQFAWRDAFDVVLVAILIYYILMLIRGTRAMQVSTGLALLATGYFAARALDLAALEAILAKVFFYLPFAVIVLFQQEIRRGLARMGMNPLAGLLQRSTTAIPYDLIVRACDAMAAKEIGALIVVEGAQSLRMYEEGAKPVDAIVTTELLVTLFMPGAPLHDGAVIIRGNRIVAANAFLPLTSGPDARLAHGTRHRAALGLSEETDALIIVISEENGSIAAAMEGTLHENLDGNALTMLLTERFGRPK
ncbi:MAG: diadenylate cyclase CdaA [Thermoanaerobaculia bacterium]